MTDNPIDPQRRAELIGKYIDIDPSSPPPWLVDYAASLGADAQTALAAIRSEAEQHVLSAVEVRRACAEYNRANAWITWELTPELRERLDQVRARQREGHRRGLLIYNDDKNKYDLADGWPAFDPDNPHHQSVPMATIVASPEAVHVLRGEYTPALFFRHAETRHRLFGAGGLCDLRLPGGCDNGIAGMETRLVAIPYGTHIYMLNVCGPCGEVLAQSFDECHPDVPMGNVRKTKAGRVVPTREPSESGERYPMGLDGRGVPPRNG
ncbi:hypothetical protein [Mycobacterium shimoidei]|uniref:hypothetical protein n=1 Tax=Mycobacterium shimoidei TaxID=29313 RepID=UPI000848E72C|nr:hypothetical protein [Mycobacterium shimoidei]MCV7259204.1 hypothetical protein [Mycobacterium shimoidei]ODR05826.1 hypothetical protein BHQ16_21995 [Mycobacterium shimoidei]ORW79602.1 hypothetical protein AWC26_14375 [Mycobacterium shimoidei]